MRPRGGAPRRGRPIHARRGRLAASPCVWWQDAAGPTDKVTALTDAAPDPHAGPIAKPTIGALRGDGLDGAGPVRLDRVFVRPPAGRVDATAGMGHEPGQAPVARPGLTVDPAFCRRTAPHDVKVTAVPSIVRNTPDPGLAAARRRRER
jgi:hypothetical protein